MTIKIFQETKKKYLTYLDREIDVLDKLNAYFRKHPSQSITYVEACYTSMCRTGRISQTQYEVLRSIWNNLEPEKDCETSERC